MIHRTQCMAIATLALVVGGCATTPPEPAMAYEGARVIVGDGRVIENATVVVRGEKLAQVGQGAAP
jgi:hypothetical protein